VTGSRCLFENCRILGNQDTLYAAGEGAYQYYKNCYIEGTVDFIFGEATAVFESCMIHAKSNGFISAASTSRYSPFGFVFIDCTLRASPNATRVMLGRPWRQYAKVVYIRCRMGNFIAPEGWQKWAGPATGDPNAYYAEYGSEGVDVSKRVPWSKQLTEKEAAAYTLSTIFKGQPVWPPEAVKTK
jgi:pectinesterase